MYYVTTMEEIKFENIREKFPLFAQQSGHGEVCWKILERDYKGTPYSDDLETLHGITERMYPAVISDCKQAFQKSVGTPYYLALPSSKSISSKRGKPIKRSNYHAIASHTHAIHIPALQKIMRWGLASLTEREFRAMCATAFFKAEDKQCREEIAQGLSCSAGTTKRIVQEARKKLQAQSIDAGITDNPYLRVFLAPKTLSERLSFPISNEQLDLSDPKTALLHKISETLFLPRAHAMICLELFTPSSRKRNRAAIAKKLSLARTYHIGVLPKALTTLKRAATLEDPSLKLSEHIEMLRSGLLYTNFNSSHTVEANDNIDEDKINFDVPGMRDILEVAYNIRHDESIRASSTPIFIATGLYNSEHKMSQNDIARHMKYSVSCFKDAPRIKSRIKNALIASGKEHLAEHPVLQTNAAINKYDIIARQFIESERFQDLYDRLDRQEKQTADLASASFNPRIYYCYFMAILSKMPSSPLEISKEFGFSDSVSTKNIIGNASNTLNHFLGTFKNVDTTPAISL